MPVTKTNMNYAIVLLAGISLFAWVYWIVSGHKYFIGPRVQTESIDDASKVHSEDAMKPGRTV